MTKRFAASDRSDASGGNLPKEYGPWQRAEFIPTLLLAEPKDPVHRAIEGFGFLLLAGSSGRPQYRI